MHEIRRGYVDGLWGQVHYRACGDGPVVVLLHQTSVSGVMFEAGLMPLARRGLRAIALDTPGYGQSAPPPAPPSMQGYADNLLVVLDALGLERPHILGHHTGGGIAAIHAAHRPERIDRLIMQGVPWFDAVTLAWLKANPFKPFVPKADGSHLVDAWDQRLKVSPGWTDVDAMHRLTLEMLARNRTYYWGFDAAAAHDLKPDLEAIRAPTLLFTNTGDTAMAMSEATAKLRPDFAVIVHRGGTNDYVDEEPEAWADVVAHFLEEGEAVR